VRICLVNYRYFVSSGPERYLFGVKELLEERGHEVVPFSVRYGRNEPSPWSDYFVPPIAGDDEVRFRQHSWNVASVRRALERAFYSPEVHDALARLLRDARPDVAYVLHYMRKLSPSVLTALHEAGVPTVVRFSDFAMVCPQAHMVRSDRICELCVRRGPWPSVPFRCVQGSLGASAVNAAAMQWGRRKGFFDLPAAFVAPSRVMVDKMVEGGMPASKMHHLPTFVRAREPRPFAERARRVCYVGRIERIKGLVTLFDAWEMLCRDGMRDVELVVAGDLDTPCGRSLEQRLRERPIPGVTLAGQLDEAGVVELLQSSQLSVVPSLWYENTPNSLLESLACGTPVVTAELGSMCEMICDTRAGVLFDPGDAVSLAAALQAALESPSLERMGREAHLLATTRYAPETHVDGLLQVLGGVLR
jgi:glycosyltransferase involved in cell wall biosynthesis